MANPTNRQDNAVLLHHPEAVDLGRENLMGRHAAGPGFLDGFARHAGTSQFYCHVLSPAHGEDFRTRVQSSAGAAAQTTAMMLDEIARLPDTARTLFVPDPSIGVHAWRRRSNGGHEYSICGINHTVSSDGAMDGIGALLTSPVQPWDAVICTSRAAKSVIVRLLDNYADFLNQRGGGAFKVQAKLPVIPLGVDCDRFVGEDDRQRIRQPLRRGLGIGEDDIAVLYFGRLSFYAKAHPLPMYLALEMAAQRTGKRVHLLQSGRFPNEGIEREFRDGARQFAPSVNPIFLDGRDQTVSRDVWYAADIFTSLSDNIQESFGLTPIEAMAAGLPCVVTDWNGYRDTVRDGEDGFCIPTWLPLPGSGMDLILENDALVGDVERDRNYNHYCGIISQCTTVDVSRTAEVFTALIENPDLRQRMGQSGRQRARDTFDWRIVVGAYQDLWRELAHIRSRTGEVAGQSAGRPAHPLRDDPFASFAVYPSNTIDGETTIRLAVGPGQSADQANQRPDVLLQQLRRASMNDFATAAMLPQEDIEALIALLARSGEIDVFALAETLPERKRFRLPRTLGWLGKLGVIELVAAGQSAVARDDEPPADSANIIDTAPVEVSRMVDLGRSAAGRGAWTAAEDYFNRALRVDPGDAGANAQMGNLLARRSDMTGAIGHFRRALTREPANLAAQRDLGKALILAGREDDGVATLEQAASLAPQDAETHYLLGAAYRRAGEANKALARLERCADLDPTRADALIHLGLTRKILGRRDEALATFEQVLGSDPRNVFARAAVLSMKFEADGRKRVAGSDRAKRVALHFNRPGQFSQLEPLFQALGEEHWPLITGDGREMQEFGPAAVVIAGEHVSAVRKIQSDAFVVNLRPGLSSMNFLSRVTDPGDAICVTGPDVATDIRARSALDGDHIWITGIPAMDALFDGGLTDRAEEREAGSPTVLYAPTDRLLQSSVGLLGRWPVELLRGRREDINVILMPHPAICEQAPGWLADWAKLAGAEPNVELITDPSAPTAQYMARADMMVSDASSAMLEFLALDRPMALITHPERFRDETHYDPAGYEWAWRDMGHEVHDVELLSEVVEKLLGGADPCAEARARYRRHLFGDMTDGRAAERVVAHISAIPA